LNASPYEMTITLLLQWLLQEMVERRGFW
jgi:hypothetical protein